MGDIEKQLEQAIKLSRRWVEFGQAVHGWEYFGDYDDIRVGVYRAVNSDHTATSFGGVSIGLHDIPTIESTLPNLKNLDETLEKASKLLKRLVAEQKKMTKAEQKQAVEEERLRLVKRLKELK